MALSEAPSAVRLRADDTMPRILLVDGGDSASELVERLLASDLHAEWRCVAGAEALTNAVEAECWDVVVCAGPSPHLTVPAALALIRESGHDGAVLAVSA